MNARSTRFTQDEVRDLIIVGGGINGAGIAADATGRGLKLAYTIPKILPVQPLLPALNWYTVVCAI